jgi:hypothetical protein
MIITSVSDLSLEKMTDIFPNPSNGDFSLSLSNFAGNKNVSVTIYNLDGKAVYTKLYNIGDNDINNVKVFARHLLSAGNYFVVAKGNSAISTVKLLICK